MTSLALTLALIAQAPRPARPSPQAPRAAARQAPASAVPPPMVGPALPAPPPATLDGALAVMKARGRPEVRLDDFGAVPNQPNGLAVRRAIRAARAAFAAPGLALPPGARTLRVPAGTWAVDRPTPWEAPDVAIVGEGPSSILTTVGGGAFPPLIVGVSATPLGKAMTADHGGDAFGRLDASAAPRAGYRYSWRNRADTHLAGWAAPWNLGPPGGWSKAPALTVEFALDATSIPIGRAMIAGMSVGPDARPYFVYASPGRINLRLRLKDGSRRELAIPYTPAAKVERFGFQVDLASGSALGWHDGAIAPLLGDAPPAGSALADNENEPFHMGSAGRTATQTGDYFQANPTPDADYLGLRVGNAARYKVGKAGDALARLDGGAIGDNITYFDSGPSCVACLPLRDDPATLAEDRMVAWASGVAPSLRGFLMAVDKAHKDNDTSSRNVSVADLTVRCNAPNYGEALSLGAAINFSADRAAFLGGAHGIGTPAWLANYYHRLNQCVLAGTDAALYLVKGQAILRDCQSPYLGRRSVWLVGSRVTIEHWPLPNDAPVGVTAESLLYTWGGDVSATDLGADIESGDKPSVALYWAVAAGWEATPSAGYLELRRCGAGSPLKTIPIVRLESQAPGKLAQARITDTWTYGPNAGTVQTFGGWDVSVDSLLKTTGPAVLDLSSPGPPAPGQLVGTVTVAGAK